MLEKCIMDELTCEQKIIIFQKLIIQAMQETDV